MAVNYSGIFGIFVLSKIRIMKKIVPQDAFIAPFLEKQTVDETDPKLKELFIERNRPELERMWQDFLNDYAMEKIAEEHPLLLKKIEDTPLSARAKNNLRVCDIYTVADLSAYSVPEVEKFRGMGEKTLTEIVDYMKEVLG